jgi:hypothetical protein
VDEILRVLSFEVPLRVTTHPRAVVEQTEEVGSLPLPGRGDYLSFAHMKVVVPERVDARFFIGPCFARDDLGVATFAAALPVAEQAAVLHETAHRRIGRERAYRSVLLLRDHNEVVVVELVGPTPVLVVLLRDRLRERLRYARMRARVLGHLALEREEGVRLGADGVVHLLDRLGRVAQRLARRRVSPRRVGELGEAARELALRRRGREELADDRKAQPRPAHSRGCVVVLAHRALRDRREGRRRARGARGGRERRNATACSAAPRSGARCGGAKRR